MEKEITGKFLGFGPGRQRNMSWLGIKTGQGREEAAFLDVWGAIPEGVQILPKGTEVKAVYEEQQVQRNGKSYTNKTLKSIDKINGSAEPKAANGKYERYKEYQHKLLEECYKEATDISKESAKEIALAFFEKRCSPLAYFE